MALTFILGIGNWTLKKRFWTTGATTFYTIEHKTTELSTYITAPTDTAAGSAPLDAGSTRLPSAHDEVRSPTAGSVSTGGGTEGAVCLSTGAVESPLILTVSCKLILLDILTMYNRNLFKYYLRFPLNFKIF